ncbi:MAG: hypothetical protein HC835_07905 [Oscillatoriales cyanobacterium RM2_1_1]|nr:hypothetical protein [Oscillatoriales cyanobacterium SM2_3_0]NJO45553.1 hypothetical protein [Oscillatoriales cyanobacterium RM2_1_1]
MPVQSSHYEALLTRYCNPEAAIALLRQHRPYLEMLPSLRRPAESLITIPLPIVRLRDSVAASGKSGVSIAAGQAVCLPCDLSVLLCDPEWKVKVGGEIFIYIYRPHETFSDLLSRWRLTQIWLDRGYDWVMPHHYSDIYSQEGEKLYPLFVLFPATPDAIQQGLIGAQLPFVVYPEELGMDSISSSDSEADFLIWGSQETSGLEE